MGTKPFHIVFAGGGTAGHLFPGLAVAAELATLTDAPRITFAGCGKPFEAGRVADSGWEYLSFPCAPLPHGPRSLMWFLTENVAGYRSAKRFLRREQINAVVGLGGYASVPMARAAIAIGVPLVLLEQNAYPGKVTRWLAPHADLICVALDETRKHLRCVGPVRVTGNPIRAGFFPTPERRKTSRGWRQRLLVLGGSGGAQSLNEHLPHALYRLREQLAGWQIVHQVGPNNVGSTRELYRKLTLPATIVPFVQNLPQVLRRTDVAVCRAGGTTLAELAATGVPALLIPYPRAADDHQRRNAQVFVTAGAARMVDEQDFHTRLDVALIAPLAELLVDSAKRQTLSSGMLRLARPDAAWQVAMMVYDVACHTTTRKVA